MKKWLISFSYTAVFYKPDGRHSTVGPSDTFALTEQHPAKFVVKMQQDFDTARNGKSGRERRGDMLHKINWSIEVPDGVLTEDEADMLS